jgi:thiamine-phosphate pyrophosphorylase
MLRYAITSRALYPGDELQKESLLLREVSRWATDGVDLIQLREKDLPAAALASLARKILETIATIASQTKLLINARADIAIATGAHGVHLTAAVDELTPNQVRSLYTSANLGPPVVTVSCHTVEAVRRARQAGADAVLFAPVFEKSIAGQMIAPGHGLDGLRAACTLASGLPIYALGGVTFENAGACHTAGAAGIAGIRLFHRD